jgi:energy-coupling factor transporter ATP-binding protein EcfA2
MNLIVGANGCGKTFLLKSMYCAARAIEAHKRGNENRTAAEILADKLYWTFQPGKIGDLVRRPEAGQLHFSLELDGGNFSYSFGRDTSRQISSLASSAPPRAENSVCLPAKEVLSLHGIILKSREEDSLFGFDDTYLDLARALRQPTTKGRNYAEFAESRARLEDMLGGRVELDEATLSWHFRTAPGRGGRFPMGTTAEGVKKIAILDTLLGSRYLTPGSIVFVDEPEAALHPASISALLEIIALLAARGIQFVMATHSYFVIKKLAMLAPGQPIPVSVLVADEAGWHASDLRDGLPDNPIVGESVRLYQQEVDRVLQ